MTVTMHEIDDLREQITALQKTIHGCINKSTPVCGGCVVDRQNIEALRPKIEAMLVQWWAQGCKEAGGVVRTKAYFPPGFPSAFGQAKKATWPEWMYPPEPLRSRGYIWWRPHDLSSSHLIFTPNDGRYHDEEGTARCGAKFFYNRLSLPPKDTSGYCIECWRMMRAAQQLGTPEERIARLETLLHEHVVEVATLRTRIEKLEEK